MPNKRRYHRIQPTGLMPKDGTIFADLKSAPNSCSIVDISAGGACLDVHGDATIPERFILSHGGVKKACRVVWQKSRRVGVSFC